MLGDMDIEVGIPEEPGAKPAEQAWVEERPEREETERAPGTADPVRMYLKQMSRIPLLTREEEVAIAKEIEAGEHEVRVVVFSLDAARDYVIGLGERLRLAEIEAAHIFDGDDPTETTSGDGTEGPRADTRADGFLKQVSRLKRLARERQKLVAEAARVGTSKIRKARIARRLEVMSGTARQILLDTEIGSKHITTIVDRLKEARRRVDTALREIQHVESRVGQSAATIIKHAPRLRAEGKETAKLARSMFKAPAADVVRAGTSIRENRRTVQEVLREIDMAADELPAVLETIRRGESKAVEGKRRLIEANLRLVVSIARRSMNRGVGFLDLIQEGNIGLMRAVEKFEYQRGYKFATYATWWIRQSVSRGIADQARTIRIPVHMIEAANKVSRTSRYLVHQYGCEPTAEQIAEQMEIPVDEVRKVLKIVKEPLSLETPIGDDGGSPLGDFVEDRQTLAPTDAAMARSLEGQTRKVLVTLTPREEQILRLRFGIGERSDYTLEEVGQRFAVTRERIRQIEATALRKLRSPKRSRALESLVGHH